VSHRISRRSGATALVVMGALLGALLIAVPAAPAATIYSCQKKKGGTIRIVSSKTKCKKTEKKIKWSTTGPAGKNGTNGANGTNGTNGTNGGTGATGPQGPGAVRFSGGTNITFAEDTEVVAPFTIGPVTLSFFCGNAVILNGASMKVTSTTAGTVFTTAIWKESTEAADDNPSINFQNAALAANTTETDSLAVAGGDATNNPSTFTSVIDTGTQTLIVTGRVELSSSCTIRGTVVPATS
jgi:hypothetical protein